MEFAKYVPTLPTIKSCDEFQLPQVTLEEVTAVKTGLENGKEEWKGRCWVCSSPLKSSPESDEETVLNVFEDLCTILNFTCVTSPDVNKEIKNTDICKNCSDSVRTCRNILRHVQRLQRKFKGIQNQLKKYIVQSYSIIERDGSCDQKDTKVCVKKTMVQCWSECRVDVAQLARVDEKFLEKGSNSCEKPRRRPGRPPKKRKVDNIDIKLELPLVTNDLDMKLLVGSTKENERFNEPDPELEEPDFFEENVTSEISYGTATDWTPEVDDDKLPRKSSSLVDDKKSLKQPFKCVKCGKVYRTQVFYNAHMENHPEELPFPCGQCGRRFSMKQRLAVHVRSSHGDSRTHSDKDRLKTIDNCPHCGLEFVSVEDTGSEPPNDKINSDIPNKVVPGIKRVYKTEKQKRNHIRACKENPVVKSKSSKDTRLPCDQLSSMLQRHVEFVHSTEKKFECDTCHVKFRRSHQLFYHQRRHTGELPYICEFCGKGFHVQEKLRLHIKIHSEKKTVPCPKCGKLFLCKQYVSNHISTFHNKSRKGRIYRRNPTKKRPEDIAKVQAEVITFSRNENSKKALVIRSSQEQHLENTTEIDLLVAGDEINSNKCVSQMINLGKVPIGIAENAVAVQETSILVEEKESAPDDLHTTLQEKPPEFIFDGNNYVLEYIVS
ncbi:unnamed protein product [Allacma fusca]|uniref:C2H2-type domain-containing protein n=1 Tax=Allacma fusca TaxID=39272 RepID=A0A8J2J727_9HEXA|nr:unnamed protein product [Allacma fusca]